MQIPTEGRGAKGNLEKSKTAMADFSRVVDLRFHLKKGKKLGGGPLFQTL